MSYLICTWQVHTFRHRLGDGNGGDGAKQSDSGEVRQWRGVSACVRRSVPAELERDLA
jgi:hypothetical protein